MTRESRNLAALRNLGPVTARRLADLGISDEAELRRIGPVAAYRRLKFAHPRETTLVALYALHGALTGTPWTDLSKAAKDELRRAAIQNATVGRAGRSSG